MLVVSGDAPAMDVSVPMMLRGGGGAESSECGWYAGTVERLLPVCCCWTKRDLKRSRRCVGQALEMLLLKDDAHWAMGPGQKIKGRKCCCNDMLAGWSGDSLSSCKAEHPFCNDEYALSVDRVYASL